MKRFLLVMCLVGSLHASEFSKCPKDMQGYILTFLGYKRPVGESVKDVLSLRRVSKKFNRLLSDMLLLKRLFERSIIESKYAVFVFLWRERRIAFLLGRNDQDAVLVGNLLITSTISYASISSSLSEFVGAQYTEAEVKALVRYIVRVFRGATQDEKNYLKALLVTIESKGLLVDYLEEEMKECYQLQPIGILDEVFYYRSLEACDASEELIVSRFERFKLAVPFFSEMYVKKFVKQGLKVVLRIQINDFATILKRGTLRKELRSICRSLAKVTLCEADKERWLEISQEVLEPVKKRSKVKLI